MSQLIVHCDGDARTYPEQGKEVWHKVKSPLGKAPGFYLKITPAGRDWYYRFQSPTLRQRKLKLGSLDSMNLSAAVIAYTQAYQEVQAGKDPKQEQKLAVITERLVGKAPRTVNQLLDLWFEAYQLDVKPQTADNMISKINKWMRPALGSMEIADLKPLHVKGLRDQVYEAGFPGASNSILTAMKVVFKWSVNELHMENSPAAFIIKRYKSKPRAISWNDEQVALIWNNIDKFSLNAAGKLALRCLILLGLRRQEVCALRRQELTWHDDGTATITLPNERTKTEQGRKIYCSAFVTGLLQEACEISPSPRYVFSTGTAASHINPNHVSNQLALFLRLQDIGGVLHSARNTMLSGMLELGIAFDVADSCLGHVRPGVGGSTYDQSQGTPQQKVAWQTWSDHVQVLAGGPKVSSTNVIKLKGVA